MHDPDAVRRHCKLVSDDLSERGSQPLTMRGRSDARLDQPGRVHGHLDRYPAGRHVHATLGEGGRAVAGALAEGGDAETEITSLRARLELPGAESGEIDGFDRSAHGFDVACLIEHQSGRRSIGKGPDQVAT